MKIAINGEIIDTENIYKISKVNSEYKGGSIQYFNFNITLFNKITVTVSNQASIFLDGDFRLKTGYFEVLKEKATAKDLKEHPIYVEAFNKINNLREKIIKVWSNDQSTIPQFNLE